MFGIFRRGVVADLLSGHITVVDFYNRLFLTALLGALAILTVSFAADVAGQDWVNIVIIPVWMAAVMYVKYHINTALAILGAGATISTLRDANRQRIIDDMQSGWKKWEKITNHAALFGGVFGLTRFLVPIKAYPFMGLVLLGALLTLGMIAWIEGAGKWYTRYAYGIVFVALAIGLFGTFSGKPAESSHPAAPIVDGAKRAVKSVTASLPTVSFSSDNPAGQKWDLFKPVRDCSVGWNAEENGPWCKAIIVPPGTYRIKSRFTGMWQHANTSRNGILDYHSIPAQGIMLNAIWNKNEEFFDEFLQMAPLGGNMWFGRLVARVGDKLIYDPYEHGGFTVTEPTKVLVGPNIPPLEQYVSADKGDLPHDIQRLRQ